MQPSTAFAALVLLCPLASNAQIKRTSVPLGDALDEALAKTSLTTADAHPFHIRITVDEPENPQSPYQGSIEEWWISKDQWRREVTDKDGLHQTIVVANGTTTEKDEGEYFPLWLRSFVNAAFDPIPNSEAFRNSGATIDQITLPNGQKSSPNVRLQSKIGTGERATDAFSNVSFDNQGRLDFYGSPRYSMEFHDYRKFANKDVAREFVDHPEPGTRLVGKVITLEDESKADRADLFTPLPNPDTDSRFRSITVNSQQLESFTAGAPPIVWPTVRSGNTRGQLAMYISIDSQGQVREAWPLNSDNAGLEDPTREQVKKWKINPPRDKDGKPLQIDGGLGFHFDTKVDNPLPVLTSPDDIAKQMSGCTYHPKLPAGVLQSRQSITVRLSVNEQGKLTGESFKGPDAFSVFGQSGLHTRECIFKPYLVDGRPSYYFIDLTFTAP